MASRCGFSLHCSTSEVKHLFRCLWAILIFSSQNCQYSAFADISIKILVSQPLPDSVYLTPASLASSSAPLCYSQCWKVFTPTFISWGGHKNPYWGGKEGPSHSSTTLQPQPTERTGAEGFSLDLAQSEGGSISCDLQRVSVLSLLRSKPSE